MDNALMQAYQEYMAKAQPQPKEDESGVAKQIVLNINIPGAATPSKKEKMIKDTSEEKPASKETTEAQTSNPVFLNGVRITDQPVFHILADTFGIDPVELARHSGDRNAIESMVQIASEKLKTLDQDSIVRFIKKMVRSTGNRHWSGKSLLRATYRDMAMPYL